MNGYNRFLAIAGVLAVAVLAFGLGYATRHDPGANAPTSQTMATPAPAPSPKPEPEKVAGAIATVTPAKTPTIAVEDPAPVPNNEHPRGGDPVEPTVRTKTFALMPGQAFNVPNHKFRKIEIHSEFPLRIMTGKCHSDYTVEFFCDGDPADLFVEDRRHPAILGTPRGNSVTLTVTEF